MGFKENLKSELEYQGILIKELSSKTGIKRKTIDNYLSTHNAIPNAEVAVKIAKALDTTVEYLITGKYGESESENQNPEITELAKLYKSLSGEKQKALLAIARVL